MSSFAHSQFLFIPRLEYTFELYSENERIYLFGTDDADSHKEWVKCLAKVTPSSPPSSEEQMMAYSDLVICIVEVIKYCRRHAIPDIWNENAIVWKVSSFACSMKQRGQFWSISSRMIQIKMITTLVNSPLLQYNLSQEILFTPSFDQWCPSSIFTSFHKMTLLTPPQTVTLQTFSVLVFLTDFYPSLCRAFAPIEFWSDWTSKV